MAGEFRARATSRTMPPRADFRAMNLYRWLATVFMILALAGCAQVATWQGQAPYAPSSNRNGEYPRDRGGDGGGGGGGGGM
jgi:hypothetical protein